MRKKLRVALILTATMAVSLLTSTRLPADTGTCGGSPATLPFTDVMSNGFFCKIAEAFFSGLTNGTTPTTYSPSDSVPRDQMAAFITRTQDSSLRRGSKRAALQQFWTTTPRYDSSLGGLGTTPVGDSPELAASDGEDLWVANLPVALSRECEEAMADCLRPGRAQPMPAACWLRWGGYL